MDKAEGPSPTVVHTGAQRREFFSVKPKPTPGEAKKSPSSKKPPRHSGLDPESSSAFKILRRVAPKKTILDSGSSPE
ncbi:MAG: hypothetical protein LBS70_07855 [Candidatus Accumulibacter sp.]|nr:hypothetical protein [Accumulibacter sp.]